MPKFFDIHSHLNFSAYDGDRGEVIDRLAESNTATIVVGTDFLSSEQAVKLAEAHDNIYACVGVHPVDDPSASFEVEKFDKLANHKKTVAIGECGLDFFHAKKEEDLPRQKELFLKQAHFALERDLPLMIHSRAAYPELLTILESFKREHGEKLRGNVHFFAGDIEVAERFLDIGFTLSFTGVITFARNYDEVIRFVPLEMMLSETDAPFVTPEPYRGKRNEPSYVSEVVRALAKIRNEDFEEVQKALVQNACRVFGLVL